MGAPGCKFSLSQEELAFWSTKFSVLLTAHVKYPVQLEDWRTCSEAELKICLEILFVSLNGLWIKTLKASAGTWAKSSTRFREIFGPRLCPTQLLGGPDMSYMASFPFNIKPIQVHRIPKVEDEWGWLVAFNQYYYIIIMFFIQYFLKYSVAGSYSLYRTCLIMSFWWTPCYL